MGGGPAARQSRRLPGAGVNLRRRYRAWKFGRALDRLYAEMSLEWKALTDEEQGAEINRIVREVRAERAARLTDSATSTEIDVAL